MQAVPSRLSLLLILGTFLGSFFEGIAGFGIPAMLVAPLLVRAGISTFSAILISLSANIGAVTFGALGTPLKLAPGIESPNDTIHYVLLFNALPIFLLPTLIAFLVQKVREWWLYGGRSGSAFWERGCALYCLM